MRTQVKNKSNDPDPYTVIEQHGTQFILQRRNKVICRDAQKLKKYTPVPDINYRERREAHTNRKDDWEEEMNIDWSRASQKNWSNPRSEAPEDIPREEDSSGSIMDSTTSRSNSDTTSMADKPPFHGFSSHSHVRDREAAAVAGAAQQHQDHPQAQLNRQPTQMAGQRQGNKRGR